MDCEVRVGPSPDLMALPGVPQAVQLAIKVGGGVLQVAQLANKVSGSYRQTVQLAMLSLRSFILVLGNSS